MTRRKKSCTDCEFCNDAEPVDGLRYFCDKKNIYFDPYKTITCRLFRQVSSSVLRIRARWAAMQLVKKKAAEEKERQLALMLTLPYWLHVGAEFIETCSGYEGVITDIDPTREDGIIYRPTNRPGWDGIDGYDTADSIIERTERGMLIFRNYTPEPLKDGFRWSDIEWDSGQIIYSEQRPDGRTDEYLKERYEVVKPEWI